MNFREHITKAGVVLAIVSLSSLTHCLAAANSVTLSTYALPVTGTAPNYSVNVGTIDGLGLGTPSANVAQTPLAGGRLWWTTIYATLGFATNGTGTIAVKVSTNYAHASVQTPYVCMLGPCSSTTPTAITTSYQTVISGLSGGTFPANFGTLLTPTNGAAAFTGADNVTVTIQVSSSSGTPATCTLTFNLTVQNALQLTLATSGSGVPISPASDFSATWGNVNGLGIGAPNSGLTIYSSTGGVVYETPYTLLPVFSSFTSTTCSLSVYASSNFSHSMLLAMQDAGTTGGPYTTISLSSASPTSISTSATSGATVTRYLGMFVSNQNGAGVFSGADNATLTLQITVP